MQKNVAASGHKDHMLSKGAVLTVKLHLAVK
jgi:hypothetical protein